MAAANLEIRVALATFSSRRVSTEERALAKLEAKLEELHLAGWKRIPRWLIFPADLPADHGIEHGTSIKYAIKRIFDDLMEQPLAGWDARQARTFPEGLVEWLPSGRMRNRSGRMRNRGVTCSECVEPAARRGLCNRHYMRHRRAG